MIKISGYRWMVGIVLAVPLLAVASYYFYWYARSEISRQVFEQGRNSGNEALVAQPPDELTIGFDPSANAGMYSVISVDKASGRISLRYEYPKALKGETISPVLMCELWDSKLFAQGSVTPRYLSSKAMIDIMNTSPKEQLLLSGKCSDVGCLRMDRGCTLTITQERQNENQ